jgi:hypothetical protein
MVKPCGSYRGLEGKEREESQRLLVGKGGPWRPSTPHLRRFLPPLTRWLIVHLFLCLSILLPRPSVPHPILELPKTAEIATRTNDENGALPWGWASRRSQRGQGRWR